MENLIVPSIPGIRVACSPHSLRWLREHFLEAVGVDSKKVKAKRRIYIARKQGGWRSVLNDGEVSAQLEKEGFECLAAEKLSLAEQIQIFSEAEIICGLHGSGLTNMLFFSKMPPLLNWLALMVTVFL